MTEASSIIEGTPEQVFSVLADGWLYPLWVVGASHMRDVDPNWPAVGTRLHHSVGPWPLQVRDSTLVIAVEPNRMLELDARIWPTGLARVRLVLTPHGPGSTEVTMDEWFARGPASSIPLPVQAVLFRPRNAEALARLRDIVEHRAEVRRPVRGPDQPT